VILATPETDASPAFSAADGHERERVDEYGAGALSEFELVPMTQSDGRCRSSNPRVVGEAVAPQECFRPTPPGRDVFPQDRIWLDVVIDESGQRGQVCLDVGADTLADIAQAQRAGAPEHANRASAFITEVVYRAYVADDFSVYGEFTAHGLPSLVVDQVFDYVYARLAERGLVDGGDGGTGREVVVAVGEQGRERYERVRVPEWGPAQRLQVADALAVRVMFGCRAPRCAALRPTRLPPRRGSIRRRGRTRVRRASRAAPPRDEEPDLARAAARGRLPFRDRADTRRGWR
jgi:hypothetical protein